MTEDNFLCPENSEKLTGIRRHWNLLRGQTIKTVWKSSTCPLHYSRYARIDDTRTRPLGFYNDDAVAIAERTANGCKWIVSCHPFPDARVMRDLLGRAGVHIYTSGKSGLPAAYIAKPYIGIFSRRGGTQTVTFPPTEEIAVDLQTGEILGESLKQVSFTLEKKAAIKLIYAGPRQDYEKILRPLLTKRTVDSP